MSYLFSNYTTSDTTAHDLASDRESRTKVKIFPGWWERDGFADHVLLPMDRISDGLELSKHAMI